MKGSDGRVFKDIVIQTPTTPRMMCNLNQKFGRGFISPQELNRPLTPLNNFENCLTTYTQAAKASLRKDPNFEFFTMTLISQKMQNQNVAAILNLDQNKLFHQAT